MIYIFINQHSAGSASIRKWQKVKDLLNDKKITYKSITTSSVKKLKEELSKIKNLSNAELSKTILVSAGGDGSIHMLINNVFQLFSAKQRSLLKIGAINLGSSNDFHKPYPVPVKKFNLRISEKSQPYDIARAKLKTRTGATEEKLFMVNAGIGLTAQGNHIFNTNKIVNLFKKLNFDLANFFTLLFLLKNIKHQVFSIEIINKNHETIKLKETISNIGILKTANVSGGMNFGTPVKRNDRLLDFVYTKKIGIKQLLSLFVRLHMGTFLQDKNSGFLPARAIKLMSDAPFILEMDGEVLSPVVEAEFDLCPETIQICDPL